jgi:hypothetical protein
MTADGKLTKQAAFDAYGERTSTKPGTVSANYDRVDRAASATKPRKQRRSDSSWKDSELSSNAPHRSAVGHALGRALDRLDWRASWRAHTWNAHG